ncbi:rolling circle replication-associated protein [Cupriavidus campinensis]
MLGTIIGSSYDASQPDFVGKQIDFHRRMALEEIEREEWAQRPNVQTQTIVRAARFADGQIEVSGYQVNCAKTPDFERLRTLRRAERGEAEDRETSIETSCRRSRKMVRLKLKAIRADHMITLNYRENMQDMERAARDLKKFVRRMSMLTSNAIRGFKYVLVIEYQERGAIHFHIGVHGWQSVDIVRAIWYEIVGRAQGQIDVRGPKSRGDKRVKGVHQLAQYLCKYITKDAEGSELNKKRYWCSKGIDVPERETVCVRFCDSVEGPLQETFEWICETANLQGMKVWLPPGGGRFWIATADRWYKPPLDV